MIMGKGGEGGGGGDLGRADGLPPTATSSIRLQDCTAFDTQPWMVGQGAAITRALSRQIKTTSIYWERMHLGWEHRPSLPPSSFSLARLLGTSFSDVTCREPSVWLCVMHSLVL